MPGILIADIKPKKNAPPEDPDEMPMRGKAPMAHETAETPVEEGAEDYGAKLISDIEAVGNAHGLDAMQSRMLAKDLFAAVSKCLGGEQESAAPEMDMGGDMGGGGGSTGGDYRR